MSISNQKKIITLLKHGNRLLVEPTTSQIIDILSPELTFTEKVQHVGWKAKQEAKERGKGPIELIDRPLFVLDHKSRIVCPYGFWKRIKHSLTKAGYSVKFKDLAPWPPPEVMVPHWENIRDYKLRPGQKEFVSKVLAHRCGRFDCPPGFGKSFLIGLICALLPKAKIDVVTRRVPVLRDRIYPELCQMVGDVGIVGGGKKRKGRRVMCYTAGSMQHAHNAGETHLMFGDECHELAADNASKKLMLWDRSRNYGLSASQDMRIDGKDKRVEGIFGPIIYKVGYEEAQRHGLVIPIKVHWSNVTMDYNPLAGKADDFVTRKRFGIWRNDVRNAVIARDANRYDDNTQVLITCETLQHAVHLKKYLPDFTLVYREGSLKPWDRTKYAKMGLIPEDEPLTNIKRRIWLTKQFEQGKLKKVIATTVWNVGVSFNALEVLIRADGGGSPINDVQIPGRVSRLSEGKTHGIVHDYLDQFNSSFERRSLSRARTYKKNGWEQVMPKDSVLENLLVRHED